MRRRGWVAVWGGIQRHSRVPLKPIYISVVDTFREQRWDCDTPAGFSIHHVGAIFDDVIACLFGVLFGCSNRRWLSCFPFLPYPQREHNSPLFTHIARSWLNRWRRAHIRREIILHLIITIDLFHIVEPRIAHAWIEFIRWYEHLNPRKWLCKWTIERID